MSQENQEQTFPVLPLTQVSLLLTAPYEPKNFEAMYEEFDDLEITGLTSTVDEQENYTIQFKIKTDTDSEIFKPYITVSGQDEVQQVVNTLQAIRVRSMDNDVSLLKSEEGFMFIPDKTQITLLLQALKTEGFEVTGASVASINGASGVTLHSTDGRIMTFSVIGDSSPHDVVVVVLNANEIVQLEDRFKTFVEDGTVNVQFEITNEPEHNYIYAYMLDLDYLEVQPGLLVKVNEEIGCVDHVLIFPRDEMGAPASNGVLSLKTSVYDVPQARVVIAEEIRSARRMFKEALAETNTDQ